MREKRRAESSTTMNVKHTLKFQQLYVHMYVYHTLLFAAD